MPCAAAVMNAVFPASLPAMEVRLEVSEIIRHDTRPRALPRRETMSAVSLRAVRKSSARPKSCTASTSLADGEFCVLVGPSGCGKSTLRA